MAGFFDLYPQNGPVKASIPDWMEYIEQPPNQLRTADIRFDTFTNPETGETFQGDMRDMRLKGEGAKSAPAFGAKDFAENILQHTTGKNMFEEGSSRWNSADVNKDGKVDISDSTQFLRYAAGLDTPSQNYDYSKLATAIKPLMARGETPEQYASRDDVQLYNSRITPRPGNYGPTGTPIWGAPTAYQAGQEGGIFSNPYSAGDNSYYNPYKFGETQTGEEVGDAWYKDYLTDVTSVAPTPTTPTATTTQPKGPQGTGPNGKDLTYDETIKEFGLYDSAEKAFEAGDAQAAYRNDHMHWRAGTGAWAGNGKKEGQSDLDYPGRTVGTNVILSDAEKMAGLFDPIGTENAQGGTDLQIQDLEKLDTLGKLPDNVNVLSADDPYWKTIPTAETLTTADLKKKMFSSGIDNPYKGPAGSTIRPKENTLTSAEFDTGKQGFLDLLNPNSQVNLDATAYNTQINNPTPDDIAGPSNPKYNSQTYVANDNSGSILGETDIGGMLGLTAPSNKYDANDVLNDTYTNLIKSGQITEAEAPVAQINPSGMSKNGMTVPATESEYAYNVLNNTYPSDTQPSIFNPSTANVNPKVDDAYAGLATLKANQEKDMLSAVATNNAEVKAYNAYNTQINNPTPDDASANIFMPKVTPTVTPTVTPNIFTQPVAAQPAYVAPAATPNIFTQPTAAASTVYAAPGGAPAKKTNYNWTPSYGTGGVYRF